MSHYDDVTVTSRIDIKYSDVADKSIPQATSFVIRFLCAKGLSGNAIHSKMRPVHGDTFYEAINTCLL